MSSPAWAGDRLAQFFGSQAALDEFEKTETVRQKIQLLWALPVTQNLLKSASGGGAGGKSEGESRRQRDLGNKHFTAGRDREAVTRFSAAVAAAPQQNGRGRDLSLALANRSAALHRLGFCRLALEDISEALECGYPPELSYKVMERRLRCLLLLQAPEDDLATARSHLESSLVDAKMDLEKKERLREDISLLLEAKCTPTSSKTVAIISAEKVPELGDRNPLLPALSSAVRIQYEAGRGRFGVATRDIPAGSLVLVEQPFVSCLNVESEEDHCGHCMVACPLRQVPCRDCMQARYCSRACREAAHSYHRYECGVKDPMVALLGTLMQQGQETEGRRNYHRTCYRAVAQRPLPSLLARREELEGVTSLLGAQEGGGEVLGPGSLVTTYSLVGHRDQMSQQKMTPLLLSAVFQLRSLQLLGYFPTRKVKVAAVLTEEEVWVAELLYTLFEKMQWNTHAVTEGRADTEEKTEKPLFQNRIEKVGKALYPTLALINHSCNNNLQKYFIGSTLVAAASKLIRAGEEVTENYMPVSMIMSRSSRREYLEDNYQFLCQCAACITDLPDIKSIPLEAVTLRCPDCRNDVHVGDKENIRCPGCSAPVPVASLRAEASQVWGRLEELGAGLQYRRPLGELEQQYRLLCDTYTRLMDIVSHPCKLLYKAEQLFWRAQRLAFGNKAYMHQGEGGERYLLHSAADGCSDT